jgi:hypothetical protein
VNDITNVEKEGRYWLIKSVNEAASHIGFAAESEDASENIKRGWELFGESIEGVRLRGELINGYATDIRQATTLEDCLFLASEVQKLAYANVHGEDLDGNGVIGDTPREYGLQQISSSLDELVAAEVPPYATVDRWFLFNLIRLPGGQWIFRRPGDTCSGGYNC